MPILTFDSSLSHTPDSIRAATLQLSKIPFSTSLPSSGVGMGRLSFQTYRVGPAPTRSETEITPPPPQKNASELNKQSDEDGGFIFPRAAHTGHEPATGDSISFLSSQSLNSSFLREIPGSSAESDPGSGLESSIETLPPLQKLSGLSLLRPGSSPTSLNPSLTAPPSSSTSSSSSPEPPVLSSLPIVATNDIPDVTPTATPMGTPRPLNNSPLPSSMQTQIKPSQSHVHWRSPRSIARLLGPASPSSPTASQVNEQTPLLGECGNHDDRLHSPSNSTAGEQDLEIGSAGRIPTFLHKTKSKISIFGLPRFLLRPFSLDIDNVKTKMKHEVINVPQYLIQAINTVPAVLLGCLLNILDGVSCEFSSLPIFFLHLVERP